MTKKNIKVSVVGFGSAGARHIRILNKNFGIGDIVIISKRKSKNLKSYKKITDLKKLGIDYFIVSSKTSDHLSNIKFIEKNFSKKNVLIEKPLFHKPSPFKGKKNNYFIGYNLRFNPLLQFLKSDIKNKKNIYNIKVICNSYLPSWRSNIKSKKSYSASKKYGGGVISDLSHEIDYIRWIFGEFKINFSEKGRLSNLTKTSEDYLHLKGKIKKSNLSIDLNYFSKISKRQIFIDGKNFSIAVDLIKNSYKKIEGNRIFKKKFKDLNEDYTYIKQHQAIFNKDKKYLCRLEFAKKTLEYISNIKKWKNDKR